jgi:hypothetical protein
VKEGELTGPVYPNPRAKPLVSVVFPTPKEPIRNTMEPEVKDRANFSPQRSVASGEGL